MWEAGISITSGNRDFVFLWGWDVRLARGAERDTEFQSLLDREKNASCHKPWCVKSRSGKPRYESMKTRRMRIKCQYPIWRRGDVSIYNLRSRRSRTRRAWATRRSFSQSGRAKNGKKQCEKLLRTVHVRLVRERLLRRLRRLQLPFY